MPATIAFGKCVPHQVEGIMMGLIGSIIKVNSDIIMRLVGLLFLINSGVTREDYAELSNRMFVNSWFLFIACFSVKFVFERHEFEVLQGVIHKLETMTP